VVAAAAMTRMHTTSTRWVAPGGRGGSWLRVREHRQFRNNGIPIHTQTASHCIVAATTFGHECSVPLPPPPPPPSPQEEDGEKGGGGGASSDDGYYSNNSDEEVKRSTRLAHTRGLKSNPADRIRDKKMLMVNAPAIRVLCCGALVFMGFFRSASAFWTERG
jgi:hypothetical protein